MRSGYVALLGRPNVGKSTLLNHLLEQKISITSAKPQTTRHVLLGIKTLTEANAQIVYVDTPGLHKSAKRAINRHMNRAAADTLSYVDCVVMLVAASQWTEEDESVLKRLQTFKKPVILAINKIDRVADKAGLLPFIQSISEKYDFAQVVPISALKQIQLDQLEWNIVQSLPVGPALFAEDQLTTASQRFLAAEIIREKLTRMLHDELPYALTVEIEGFTEEPEGQPNMLHIDAVIWVERAGQKGIVIGRGGRTLKQVGQQARTDMARLFDCKVHLQTWVKVRSGWSDDEKALKGLGYFDS